MSWEESADFWRWAAERYKRRELSCSLALVVGLVGGGGDGECGVGEAPKRPVIGGGILGPGLGDGGSAGGDRSLGGGGAEADCSSVAAWSASFASVQV